jgi:hypothetical protein
VQGKVRWKSVIFEVLKGLVSKIGAIFGDFLG